MEAAGGVPGRGQEAAGTGLASSPARAAPRMARGRAEAGGRAEAPRQWETEGGGEEHGGAGGHAAWLGDAARAQEVQAASNV